MPTTGIDPDREALAFLRSRAPMIPVVAGRGEALPFDYAAAVTSLYFVARPDQARTPDAVAAGRGSAHHPGNR